MARIFAVVREFLELAPEITRVNLGGGLGIPLVEGDAPLDLAAWAALIRGHFGGERWLLEFEPGDYLVKDAGLLLAEVTQAEEKAGRMFVGINAGFNVHPEPAFYRLPLAPVPAVRHPGETIPVTIVGNINEALDVWADDVPLPIVKEGDTLCLLNAGGYGAAMASAHCLRVEMTEHLLADSAANPMLPAGSDGPLAVSNRAAWDRLYASTPELVWGAAPVPFLEGFTDEFRRSLRRPSRVLDAGTGEGRNLPVLLRCGADELHALDAAGSALSKISPETRHRVICRQAELHATGYPDAYFDAIAIIDVLETLPDIAAVLTELRRVLKPGGLLVCNIPGMEDGISGIEMRTLGGTTFLYRNTYYFRFIEEAEAEQLLAAAGFQIRRACRCEWREDGHPGFRDGQHRHTSRVYVAQNGGGLG